MDYATLDPGIRETVRFLRYAGFETTDSGDGRTKPPDERTFDEPHVMIRTSATMLTWRADTLVRVLRAAGIEVGEQGAAPVWIQASYDPVSQVAIIALVGVDDAMLARAQR